MIVVATTIVTTVLMSELSIFRLEGVVSAEDMISIDINADEYGSSPSHRMELAGKGLAELIMQEPANDVVFFCGSGNNGGDGLVAARYLISKKKLSVFIFDPKTPEAGAALLSLKEKGIEPITITSERDFPHLKGDELIIDCLLGTGVRPPLRSPMDSLVTLMNQSLCRIISCDLPTPGVHSSRIIAFHLAKNQDAEVVPIGIPEEADVYCGKGNLRIIPRKDAASHKGAGGTVLVIGGGPYQGAPFFAGVAALRAGADIVRVASPVDGFVPDIILERLSGTKISQSHQERLISLAESADVVIAGPGLGTDIESLETVRSVVSHAKRAVVDANLLRHPLPSAKEETVYTPHEGEFTRLFGLVPKSLKERGIAVRQAAADVHGILLLKGKIDVISDGVRVKFNNTGCEAMTVGGTGDVLSGIVGGLLARTDGFHAACAAAYVEGKVGENLAESLGEGLIASDMLSQIAKVLWKS